MPLIVFVLVPVAEMWILIEVGGWIGALPTIALVVVTATVGLSLLKRQGLSTLRLQPLGQGDKIFFWFMRVSIAPVGIFFSGHN